MSRADVQVRFDVHIDDAWDTLREDLERAFPLTRWQRFKRWIGAPL